jgi:hypothetical protein
MLALNKISTSHHGRKVGREKRAKAERNMSKTQTSKT